MGAWINHIFHTTNRRTIKDEIMTTQSIADNQLLKNILQHEREFRGINWAEELFDESGNEKPGFMEHKLRELAHGDLPADQVGQLVAGGLQVGASLRATPAETAIDTLLRFEQPAYEALRNSRGGDIKTRLLALIEELQNLEKRLASGNFDANTAIKMVSVSAVVASCGFLFKGGSALVGVMMLPAAAAGAMSAGLIAAVAAVVAGLAVLIAVLVGVVLVMLKQACEMHLVLNNTDYELRLYEVYCHNGKEVVRPRDKNFACIIPPRANIQIEGYDNKKRDTRMIYGGFFGTAKREGAMIGADGVIQLDLYGASGNKHQTSSFLAYEVPLTRLFGGKNGCFVKCSAGNPSASEFFKNHAKEIEAERLESEDRSGNIHIRKCISSNSGSEVHAITCYEQI